MRIGVATAGSRGDLEPYIALSQALIRAGHEVMFAAPRDARALVGGVDVRYVEMDLEVRSVLRSQEGQQWLAAGDVAAYLSGIAAMLSQARHTIAESVREVAEGADVLVTGVNAEDYALAVSQAQGIPLILGHLTPWLLTDEFPQPLTPQAVPAGQDAAAYSLLTHRMAEDVYWLGKQDDINEFRHVLGLGPAPSAALTWAVDLKLPILQAFSQHVVPRPHDWGPASALTGFWRLDTEVRRRIGEATVPGELTGWLAEGEAPVFLGFGSMPVLEPDKVMDMVVKAAERTGLRLLVGTGWSDLEGLEGSLPETVRTVGSIDHDWLFPRCRAVVHHGGAGTTAAGLTAGCPTWIYSVFSDQPFWGDRVGRLGVGGHNDFGEFDFDHLVHSLRHLMRTDVQERAAAIGAHLRREDGTAAAVQVITRLAGQA